MCLCSCAGEALHPVADGGAVEVAYFVENPEPYGSLVGAKSVLPESDDQLIHSAFLAFYDEHGILQAECDASRNGSVTLDGGRLYNIYFLANLKVDGIPAGAFVEEGEMSSYSYRMDGMDGRERIDDIAENGIPMAWSLKGWKPSDGVIQVKPRKLFSKIALTIDKSALVGSQTAMEIQNLKVRSNTVLKPFETGARASSAADMTETGVDCAGGVIAAGSSQERFVVYVPENMQGDLSGDNHESVNKKPSAEKEPVCSRLTCTAKVVVPSLTVQADYRFYIGKDASRNYDLERNCLYDVKMTLDPEHIFDPTWQVSPSITSDSRDIQVCHPDTGAKLADNDQVLVVRANRPARFRLKVSGADALQAVNVNPDSKGGKIDDLCWSSDAYCPDKSKASVYQTLLDNGITVTMDETTGVFTAMVTNSSRFTPGKDIKAKFWLMPDHKKEVSVIFKTMEDQSYTFNTDEFYFGMERKLILKGFYGQFTYLKSKEGDDYQMRVAKMDPFDWGDRYFIKPSGTMITDNLYLAAYYYADNYQLTVYSQDDLNNSPIEIPAFDILKPKLKLYNQGLFVPIDGEPREPYAYYTKQSGEEIPRSDFEYGAYNRCLRPQCDLTFDVKAEYADYLKNSKDGVYLCKMPEKSEYRKYTGQDLALAHFRAKSIVGDIVSDTSGNVSTRYPSWYDESNFQTFTSQYFNTYVKDGVWPTIEGTKLDMYLQECTHTEFVPVSGYLYDIRGSRVSVSGNGGRNKASKVYFEYAPMAPEYVAAGTPGNPLIAPYGPMEFTFNIRNIHSDETFKLKEKSFTLRHSANLSSYVVTAAHEREGDMYFGTPLALMNLVETGYGTSVEDAFGMHVTYHGYLVDGYTGLYPQILPGGIYVTESCGKIYAGAFGFGNQSGRSWDEFKDQEWTRQLCAAEIDRYNNGTMDEMYGWPKDLCFYDPAGMAGKMSNYLPDSAFAPILSLYPKLNTYLTVISTGKPKILDWEFIE